MAREVRVVLSAGVQNFVAGMEKAKGSVEAFMKGASSNKAALDSLGGAFTKVGLATLAGLGLVTKSAIDWESAWAGVTKTVDGTPEQMASLEKELRNLAKTMPATHKEIAGVAEAAGQLGVAREDVAGFTKVMIDLGETTNLSADEAATSIAQMANVMGTATSDVDRLGATLVELGNNGASTERDIMQMATRLAGAGKLIGASEADVLALANTMSSLGIEAQLGGGVMSRVLTMLNTQVISGGKNLEGFAKVAGMSATDFAAAWKSDPVAAMDAFVQGLSAAQASGADTATMLSDLGIKGTENQQVMLRLTGAGDLLTKSLQQGADAWAENSALAEEASKRYETTESKIKIAFNSMQDAAISFGGVALPVVANVATGFADLAQKIGSLPAPVQAAGMSLAAVAGGGALLAGGLIKAVTTATELHGAFRQLVPAGSALDGKLKGIGKSAAIASAAFIALKVAGAAMDQDWRKGIKAADDMASSMLKAGGAGANLDSMFKFEYGAVLKEKFEGIGESARRAFNPSLWEGFSDAVSGIFVTSTGSRIAQQFGELDKALGTLASGGKGEQAAANFRQVRDALKDMPVDQLVAKFPRYAEELRRVAEAHGVVGLSAQELADWMGGQVPASVAKAAAASGKAVPNMTLLAGSMDATAQAAADAAAATERLLGVISDKGTQLELRDSIDALNGALKENGKSLDESTEKGRANWQALLDVAKSYHNVKGSAEEVASGQAAAAAAFVNAAAAMTGSREEAAKLAEEYLGIPASVITQITAPGAKLTEQQVQDVIAATKLVPALTNAQILAPGARPSKAEIDEVAKAAGRVPGLTTAQIKTIADLYGARAAYDAIAAIKDKTVTIRANYVASGVGVNKQVAYGGVFDGAVGPTVQAMAYGGMPRADQQQPQIRAYQRGGVYWWNEDSRNPWEAFIPGDPAKKWRSWPIWRTVGERLGFLDGMGSIVRPMASGDFVPQAYVPPAGSRQAESAPLIDPAAIRAALDGAILHLSGVDYMAGAVAARIQTSIERGV